MVGKDLFCVCGGVNGGMKARAIIIAAVFNLVLIAQASAQGVQSDFNNDGKSDLTYIAIDSDDNRLEWKTKSYISGLSSDHGSFGKAGDHIILGKWDGLSLGVIKEDKTTGNVTWRIKNQSNQVKNYQFGTNKDIFVSGADVDGDGRTDAIVIRNKKKLRWQIARNPFATTPQVQEIKFGRKKDNVFFMDLDDTGDWIGIVTSSPANSKKYLARLRNLNTGEKRTIKVGNSFQRPLPVKSSDGRDIFAFANKGQNKTRVRFRNQSGKVFSKIVIPTPGSDDGTIVVGDFTNDSGEEIAIKSGNEYIIYNPFNKQQSAMANISGIPVDEININTFYTVPDSDSTPDSCGNLQLPDGGDGNLWKPNSDTMFYAVFVAHSQYTGKISQVRVYKASNNQFIKNLTYKSTANGNRTNWQDYSLTGSNYKSQYGAIRLRIDLNTGGCISAVISDPSNRVD